MEPEQPTGKLGPCPKCRGTLDCGEDRYGPYVTCLHCGKLFDLLAAPHGVPPEEPDCPPSPAVRNRGRLTGPMTRDRREMYREWCAIIRREGLTVNQTAERFGVSYRTIYRILHRHGVEHGQMEEPDQAGGPMTGAAMYRWAGCRSHHTRDRDTGNSPTLACHTQSPKRAPFSRDPAPVPLPEDLQTSGGREMHPFHQPPTAAPETTGDACIIRRSP